jgi:hypothetical protein
MVKQTWAKSSMTLHQVMGFPRVPIHGEPGKGFDFSFIQIPPGSEPEILETDVVVVGSGCGGGVVAKNLSEAGYKVIVVDKSYHWPANHLPMTETEGWVQLFHNGGFLFCGFLSTLSITEENADPPQPRIARLALLPVKHGEVVEQSIGRHHYKLRVMFEKNGLTLDFPSLRLQNSKIALILFAIEWAFPRST